VGESKLRDVRWASTSPRDGGIPDELPLSDSPQIAALQSRFYVTALAQQADDTVYNTANRHFQLAEESIKAGKKCEVVVDELKKAIMPLTIVSNNWKLAYPLKMIAYPRWNRI